jgi:hypothetical protein
MPPSPTRVLATIVRAFLGSRFRPPNSSRSLVVIPHARGGGNPLLVVQMCLFCVGNIGSVSIG